MYHFKQTSIKTIFSVQDVDEIGALSCIRRVQHCLLQFIHQYLRVGVNNLAHLFSAKRHGSAHAVVVLTAACEDRNILMPHILLGDVPKGF
jgi:hypothetical protein